MITVGSMIINSGDYKSEIRRKLAIARDATTRLTNIWGSTAVTGNTTKLRNVNTAIFPTAIYNSETWILKKMWLLQIPWPTHRTNTSIIDYKLKHA